MGVRFLTAIFFAALAVKAYFASGESLGLGGGNGLPTITSELCQKKREYLISRYKEKGTLADLARAFKQSGRRILTVGERHGESRDLYLGFLEAVKQEVPKLDCVLLEAPASYQPWFDKFNKDPKSIVGASVEMEVDGEVQRFPFSFPPVTPHPEKLHAMNLKLFAVDEDVPFGDFSLEVWNRRNRGMAARTVKLLNNGTCNYAVMINGMGHLWPRAGTASIRAILAKSGLPTYGLVLIEPGYVSNDYFNKFEVENRLSPTWIWSMKDAQAPACKDSPGIFSENFVLFNTTQGLEIPVMAAGGTSPGTWGDFDASYIVGCPLGDGRSSTPCQPFGREIPSWAKGGYLQNPSPKVDLPSRDHVESLR